MLSYRSFKLKRQFYNLAHNYPSSTHTPNVHNRDKIMQDNINEHLIFGKGINCKLNIIQNTLFIEFNPTQSLVSMTRIRLDFKQHDGIHLGYLKCFQSVKMDIYRHINSKRNQFNAIHIVGYGFAGAIAQIASLGIYKSFLIPSAITTYDSPTPFSEMKREEFDITTLKQEHFVFGYDINLKFYTKLFGYAFPNNIQEYKII